MTGDTPFLCMGICRFLGTVGFFGCGWPAFRAAQAHWHLRFERLDELAKLGRSGALALGVSVMVGFVGLAIGQRLGMGIRVRDNATSLRINVLWHCLANGSIIWLAYSGVLCAVAIGDRQLVQHFAREYGTAFFLSCAVIGLAGSVTIALCIGRLLTSGARRDGAGEKLMLILPFIVGIPMGLLVTAIWQLPSLGGAIFGFLFPSSLTTLAGGMWDRDQAMRTPGRPRPI